MANCYLSLGSNVGDRVANLKAAKALVSVNIGSIESSSAYYSTEPWGLTDQETFLNEVILVSTALAPAAVLTEIQNIEKSLGRIRNQKWGTRSIDVDILFYDQMIIEEPTLTIPHPLMNIRNFVLKPLSDIAPNFVHPVIRKTIKELYIESSDLSLVTELDKTT